MMSNTSENCLASWRQERTGCRVNINVSGQRFTARLKSLQKYPNTLLGSPLLVLFYDCKKDEYFFDRDPELFRFILNFYRLGKLHVSDVDCPEAFRDELDYFGIPYSAVDDCCWNIFKKIKDSPYKVIKAKNVIGNNKGNRIHDHTTKDSKPDEVRNNVYCTKKNNCKEIVYNETSQEKKSIKVIYTRKDQGKKERKTFFPRQNLIHLKIKEGTSLCRSRIMAKDTLQYFYGVIILASAACNALETMECSKAIKCGDYYNETFFAMETFFVVVFTADYIIRFILAKHKCVFMRNILNIIDLASIIPYYLELVFKFIIGASDVMITFRILRVLRLIKLNRSSPRLQAFALTIRNCVSDLLFLYFMCAFGILLFGGAIYYAERESINAGNFTSIPHSLWFSCVTMVTTGYGDVIPVTVLGKIFAALCGICGVLVMSLPIPIMQDKKADIVAQT